MLVTNYRDFVLVGRDPDGKQVKLETYRLAEDEPSFWRLASHRQKTAGLIWMHALAIRYSPAYLSENADGIRQDWPRIPLPNTKKLLLASAELGKQIAALLDTENPVRGVTASPIRQELKSVAVLSCSAGSGPDLNMTAGWGHTGKEGVTMPGKGKIVERSVGGKTTYDIHLNETTCWKNVPPKVWD